MNIHHLHPEPTPNAAQREAYLAGIEDARQFAYDLLEDSSTTDRQAVMANVICDAVNIVYRNIEEGVSEPWTEYEDGS